VKWIDGLVIGSALGADGLTEVWHVTRGVRLQRKPFHRSCRGPKVMPQACGSQSFIVERRIDSYSGANVSAHESGGTRLAATTRLRVAKGKDIQDQVQFACRPSCHQNGFPG
jgi:hypothetical protein